MAKIEKKTFLKIITKFAVAMGISQEITPIYCETMTQILNNAGIDAAEFIAILGRISADAEYQHYNRLPALPEFRRYHAASNPQIGDATHRAELLEWIADYCDDGVFFPMDEFQKFATRRDMLAISAAGGLSGIYRAANGGYSNIAAQLRRIGEIWDSVSADEKDAVKIGAKASANLQIENILKNAVKGV
jgi:hypothetical protein